MQNSKNIYFFNVLTYTDDFSYIVKSKKEVKVIRAHFSSAYRFILTRYPMNKGYFVELENSCKMTTYIKDRKNWCEYLAK